MKDENKTRLQLIDEIREMRRRIADPERNGPAKDHLEKASDDAYAIINSSPMVAFIWRNEEEWPVQFVSANIENVLEYQPDDFLSGAVVYSRIIHPDDLNRVAREVEKYSTDDTCKKFVHDPYRVLTKSGAVRWIEDRTNIVRDESGRITHYQGIILDITERKQAAETAAQFGRILDDSLNEIYIFDVETLKFIQVNHGARRNLGYSMEEIQELTPIDIKPEFTISLFAEITQPLLNGKRKKITFETIHKRKNGSTYPVEVHLQISTFNAKPVYIAIILDITERKHLEEMMIQSEKMLSVGGLAAGMAHEINNPLAGMMQTAGVMAGRLGTDLDIPANRKAAEEAGTTVAAVARFMELRGIPRMLETINTSGRRVAEIVENMLSFARKSEAAVATRDLGRLLDKTLELAVTDYDLKKKYDFKRIAIEKEYGDPPVCAPCEGTKIQQVLLNILRNGAEAMGDTPSPRFIFRTRREGDTAVMEIEDNGPGMDEQTRKRIFEPFFTTKPVGVGTGLGLSVSYFIITENHNGKMAVESRPGAGAKFVIRLPLERSNHG